MMKRFIGIFAWVVFCGSIQTARGGPYSAVMNDPGNGYDAPVPGFVGPHGIGKARLLTGVDANGDPVFQNPNNLVNPIFFGWATEASDYYRADAGSPFSDPALALGEVTGDNFDIVSLGDLSAAQITAGAPPGSITLQLAQPIRNLSGADFVIFENGLVSQSNQGGAGAGGLLAELAYVEVSANGTDFIRFPATSLTPSAVGSYGSLNPTNIYNLAGKHTNAYGNSWGTPFDLAQVGLQQITHVRLVDIPGSGAFHDQAGRPIYDAWLTFGSGGFDLEAVGSISTLMTFAAWPALQKLNPAQRGEADDPDGDGLPNLLEYACARVPWLADSAGATPVCRTITDAGNIYPQLSFVRDERLTDLTYEVQVSENMATGTWTTIASSTAGNPTLAAVGHFPVVTEATGSQITGIGVIRAVTVRDAQPVSANARRLFRVKISHP